MSSSRATSAALEARQLQRSIENNARRLGVLLEATALESRQSIENERREFLSAKQRLLGKCAAERAEKEMAQAQYRELVLQQSVMMDALEALLTMDVDVPKDAAISQATCDNAADVVRRAREQVVACRTRLDTAAVVYLKQDENQLVSLAVSMFHQQNYGMAASSFLRALDVLDDMVSKRQVMNSEVVFPAPGATLVVMQVLCFLAAKSILAATRSSVAELEQAVALCTRWVDHNDNGDYPTPTLPLSKFWEQAVHHCPFVEATAFGSCLASLGMDKALVLYYRGRAQRRLGREAESAVDFKAAMVLDGTHIVEDDLEEEGEQHVDGKDAGQGTVGALVRTWSSKSKRALWHAMVQSREDDEATFGVSHWPVARATSHPRNSLEVALESLRDGSPTTMRHPPDCKLIIGGGGSTESSSMVPQPQAALSHTIFIHKAVLYARFLPLIEAGGVLQLGRDDTIDSEDGAVRLRVVPGKHINADLDADIVRQLDHLVEWAYTGQSDMARLTVEETKALETAADLLAIPHELLFRRPASHHQTLIENFAALAYDSNFDGLDDDDDVPDGDVAKMLRAPDIRLTIRDANAAPNAAPLATLMAHQCIVAVRSEFVASALRMQAMQGAGGHNDDGEVPTVEIHAIDVQSLLDPQSIEDVAGAAGVGGDDGGRLTEYATSLLQFVVNFLYTDELPKDPDIPMPPQVVVDLLSIADFLQVPALFTAVSAIVHGFIIAGTLDPKTIVTLMMCAANCSPFAGASELTGLCAAYIQTRILPALINNPFADESELRGLARLLDPVVMQSALQSSSGLVADTVTGAAPPPSEELLLCALLAWDRLRQQDVRGAAHSGDDGAGSGAGAALSPSESKQRASEDLKALVSCIRLGFVPHTSDAFAQAAATGLIPPALQEQIHTFQCVSSESASDFRVQAMLDRAPDSDKMKQNFVPRWYGRAHIDAMDIQFLNVQPEIREVACLRAHAGLARPLRPTRPTGFVWSIRGGGTTDSRAIELETMGDHDDTAAPLDAPASGTSQTNVNPQTWLPLFMRVRKR